MGGRVARRVEGRGSETQRRKREVGVEAHGLIGCSPLAMAAARMFGTSCSDRGAPTEECRREAKGTPAEKYRRAARCGARADEGES